MALARLVIGLLIKGVLYMNYWLQPNFANVTELWVRVCLRVQECELKKAQNGFVLKYFMVITMAAVLRQRQGLCPQRLRACQYSPVVQLFKFILFYILLFQGMSLAVSCSACVAVEWLFINMNVMCWITS
jgi:hypothetical protein